MNRYFSEKTVEAFRKGANEISLVNDGNEDCPFAVAIKFEVEDETTLKIWFEDCYTEEGEPMLDGPSEEFTLDINSSEEEQQVIIAENYDNYCVIADTICDFETFIEPEDLGYEEEEEIEEFYEELSKFHYFRQKEYEKWVQKNLPLALKMIEEYYGIEER